MRFVDLAQLRHRAPRPDGFDGELLHLVPADEEELAAAAAWAAEPARRDEPWVESVAALLARRPPAQWADGDLPGFELALAP